MCFYTLFGLRPGFKQFTCVVSGDGKYEGSVFNADVGSHQVDYKMS
jgi:hypothetical protein